MSHKTTGAIIEINLPGNRSISGKIGLGETYHFMIDGAIASVEVKSVVSNVIEPGLRPGPVNELRSDSRAYVLPGQPGPSIDVVTAAPEPQVRKYSDPQIKTVIGMHYISTNGVEWLISFDEKELKSVVYVRTQKDELFARLSGASNNVAQQVSTSGTNCLGVLTAEVFL